MPFTLYGLKNCDTCRKACKWLDSQGIEYRFHDLRTDGLESRRLTQWIESLGWETLLNRRSTTWRMLSVEEREPLDEKLATKLMLSQPTLIKRPVLEYPAGVAAGFSTAKYEVILAGAD